MISLMLLRMAFKAIRHHVLRSLLTLLGIVIGIAGIITIAAIGKGAQQKAREQFLAYGTKSIAISAGNWMSPQNKPPKFLSLEDIETIKQQCPAVQYISPEMFKPQAEVEFEGNKTTADVIGVNEYAFEISEFFIQDGIFINALHTARQENVAVIEAEIADLLFKSRNACGHVIRINKIPFTIIGVKARPKFKGKWDGLGRPRIAIPYTTHKKYFGGYINTIFMSSYDVSQVPEITRQLEKIFRAAHRLDENESNDFMIWDNQTFANAAEEASKSVGLFALIAALIALLVGGIGVMNIMLVAVQERTKEIGIKGALGATMNVIRMQFLIEAVAICLVGGIIGVLCGISTAFFLNHMMGIRAIVEYTPVFMSFCVTGFIGLMFG